jgi:lipopolysaccharide export LptBFGC system permease protein LptF
MAITIRDAKSAPRQRNIASLVGGFVIAFGCFVLFMLVAGQLTHWPPIPLLWVLGALLATAIGIWIRVADL